MNDLLLMCMVAGRRAAIPAIRVQSVIEIEDITPIPGAPAFIRGLTALRSQALTVIDCSVALGFETA
ncbi:MAG TPA: chemotaxis protein CheW, partial [Erythrobacter sp.]|nr:chemotaxis protein CheW [Erythrobacter sp.]